MLILFVSSLHILTAVKPRIPWTVVSGLHQTLNNTERLSTLQQVAVICCHFSIILLGMTFILLSIHSDKNEMKRLIYFGDKENESRNQEEVLELDFGDVNDGGSMGNNSISREQDFVLNREIVKPSKSKY